MLILIAAIVLLVAFLLITLQFVSDERRANATLRRLVAAYRSASVRRCMRFAASKGYDPYNSHTVQARCFRLQAGSRS